MYPPPPRYEHLLGLIDDTGIYEHSRYGVPRREHGYTIDDGARALILLCMAEEGTDLLGAQRTLLAFVLSAITPEGRFRNRLHFDRRWEDEGDWGDTQGRGIWALAVAACHAAHASLRAAARSALEELPAPRSSHVRPLALAALGAQVLWSADRDDPLAAILAMPAAQRLGDERSDWPEPRLTYSNGRIPAGMLAAGQVLDDDALVSSGLASLTWLVDIESNEGHLSFTPAGGWQPGDPRPGFDQQPVEAASLSDACERAWVLTGDDRWRDLVLACGAWLMGDNDVGVPLYDPATGATRDGLMIDGANANTGAESTVSGLAILQGCSRVQSAPSIPVLRALR